MRVARPPLPNTHTDRRGTSALVARCCLKVRPAVAQAGGVAVLIALCESCKHRVVLEEATKALKLLTDS